MKKLKGRQLKSLISLTRIESPALIKALRGHLVKGLRQADAARESGVDTAHLNRTIKRLNKVMQQSRAVHS